MNVVSSILYFIGEKIQRMNGVEEVRFSPSSGEISLLVAKHNADKPSEPILAQDIVSLPPAGTSLVGVSSEGNVAPITLPLSIENGGTGKSEKDDTVKDYVTEEGEKDGWTYRKWNNGYIECWKTEKYASINLSTQKAGGVYTNDAWTSKSFNLPTDLFTEAPTMFFCSVASNGYTQCQANATSDTAVSVRMWSSYNANLENITVRLFVGGK